jgi:hypothetical protein
MLIDPTASGYDAPASIARREVLEVYLQASLIRVGARADRQAVRSVVEGQEPLIGQVEAVVGPQLAPPQRLRVARRPF